MQNTSPSLDFSPLSHYNKTRFLREKRAFMDMIYFDHAATTRVLPEAAQAAAVVKRRAVQGAHRVRQSDFLHKIAGDLVGVGAGALRPGPDRLFRKAVGADLHNGQTANNAGHGGAGGIPQQAQHPYAARAWLPENRHKKAPFTLPPL